MIDVITRAKFNKDIADMQNANKEIKEIKKNAPRPVVYPIDTQPAKKARIEVGL
jgi:hypothetical protein